MSDAELARMFLSLVLLLSAALAFGHLFERMRLPRVIGEISGGLLLGPTVLGSVAPDAFRWIFFGFPAQPALLSAFYWLGLVLLMFTAGFRVEPMLDRDDRKRIALLVVGSSVLPLACGWVIAPFLPRPDGADPLAFTLVVAIAFAVTSIPVISRIFIDLNMMGGRFAKLTISAATVQDLMLWILLAIATALQQGGDADINRLGKVVLVTAAFAAATLSLGPALLRFAGRLTIRRFTDASLTGYTLSVCLMFVTFASLLHVNIIFGALLAGLIIGRFPTNRFDPVKQRISDFAMWFFVPIYFAQVGLNLDLLSQFDGPLIAGFLATSSLVKAASIVMVMRASGTGAAGALDFAVAMNTRGGPGIVLASVAHAAGIITEPFFITLILASILTSLFAGVWFRRRLKTGATYGDQVA